MSIKTFVILKYGSMSNAIVAYNQSADCDADFTEDEQCLIVGYGWAHGHHVKSKTALEYAMELVK